MAVIDDLIQVMKNLNGGGTLFEIYNEYKNLTENLVQSTVRRTLQQYSSDSGQFLGKGDYFFSVEGIGKGVWGLREYFPELSEEKENYFRDKNRNPKRKLFLTSRIIRDTKLARHIKELQDYKCQLCREEFFLGNNKKYAEAHHIKPLGKPYNGPDVANNIIVLCPNCHVKCDYKLIELSLDSIINNVQNISQEYIDFHNLEYRIRIVDT